MARSDAIRQSLEENNTAQDAFCAERDHIRALLGLNQSLDKDEAGEPSESVVPVTRIYGIGPDLYAVFATLLTLDDKAVTRILTYCVAETLPSGSAMIEALGHHLKVDMADHWALDDTFFDLLRDKDAINAMIGELAGDDIAQSAVAQTAKVQKQVIRKYLSGEKKAKTESWQQRYMAFPMGQYTKRKGIEAVRQWEAVKDRFKTT